MRQYEVMLILPAEAEESVVGGVVDRITRLVGEDGGEVTRVDRWGRRRLAYPIAKRAEGYYLVVEFRAPPGAVAELERALHLTDEVIRHKVVVRAA